MLPKRPILRTKHGKFCRQRDGGKATFTKLELILARCWGAPSWGMRPRRAGMAAGNAGARIVDDRIRQSLSPAATMRSLRCS